MKKLFNSYWIRSGLFSIFQRFSVFIFGFLSFILLAQELLTVEELGIYALFQSVTSILEVIRNGFIRNPLIKFFNSNEEDKKEIVSNAFLLNIIITCVFIAFLISMASILETIWNAPQLRPMLYVYIFTSVLMLFVSHFEYLQQANMTFKGVFVGNFTRRGGFFLLILVFYLIAGDVDLIQLAYFNLYSVFAGGVGTYLSSAGIKYFYKDFDKVWLLKLLHYGKFTFGTNIGTTIFKNIDQWMLANLLTSSAVGLYSPALRISNLVEVPTLAVSSIVFPKVAKEAADQGDKRAKYLYEKSVGTIMALMFPATILIIFLSEPLVLLIAGEEYLAAVPILQVTIFYTLIVPFNRQFGTILDAIGKPKVNFIFVSLNATLNIIFNYIWISNIGLIGAAYGTLSTYIIGFIVIQVILRRLLDVRTMNIFKYSWLFYQQVFLKSQSLVRNAFSS